MPMKLSVFTIFWAVFLKSSSGEQQRSARVQIGDGHQVHDTRPMVRAITIFMRITGALTTCALQLLVLFRGVGEHVDIRFSRSAGPFPGRCCPNYLAGRVTSS